MLFEQIPQEENSKELTPAERMRELKEDFEKFKEGDDNITAEVVREELSSFLENHGNEISYEDGRMIEGMIDIIPVLEVKSFIVQIKDCVEVEKMSAAQSLHVRAKSLLDKYTKEAISKAGLDNLALELEDIGGTLYP